MSVGVKLKVERSSFATGEGEPSVYIEMTCPGHCDLECGVWSEGYGVWGMKCGVWRMENGYGAYQLFRVATGDEGPGLNCGCSDKHDRVLLTGHLMTSLHHYDIIIG